MQPDGGRLVIELHHVARQHRQRHNAVFAERLRLDDQLLVFDAQTRKIGGDADAAVRLESVLIRTGAPAQIGRLDSEGRCFGQVNEEQRTAAAAIQLEP